MTEPISRKPQSKPTARLGIGPLLWAARCNLQLALLMAAITLLPMHGAGAPEASYSPFECGAELSRANPIDDLVFTRLNRLGIQPANICSDGVFVRRAYLDVIGTLPSAYEAQQFILESNPKKRPALIERLLKRPEFADYWAMKWSDLLRVKAEFPINLWPNAAQAYHRWIRTAVEENKPYDQIVRELLTSSGSNFRDPPVNFYRALQNREPQGLAQAAALAFMGVRPERLGHEWRGMGIFFCKVGYKSTAEWKEEIVFFDPGKTNEFGLAGDGDATFPDGKSIRLSAEKDPREAFADWLIDPKNPWFTRNIANRVWSWLLGRGIIHEPDDIRPDNLPSNPALLARLEKELVASHYDLKHLYRLILNSQTYQLSSIPKSQHPQAAANFAAYPVRRLEAEVLVDALDQITGSTEKYSSAIPEPYTFIPESHRSIALPDGSITSSFLEMFGRPPRDTGLESERDNRPTAAQELHLLNSNHILRKIEQSRNVQFQTQSQKTPAQITAGIYLGILARFPTADELRIATAHFQAAATPREAALDLAWALINTAEFLCRH